MPQSSRDFVNQDSDFYRFRLRSASSIDLALRGLKKNADLSLYRLKKPLAKIRKRLGEVPFERLSNKRIGRFLDEVGTSNRRGKRNEQLEVSADPGTYLIRVFSKSRRGTKYRLFAAASESVVLTDRSQLSASSLPVPSTIQDSLGASNPVDLYEFSLTDRKRVTLKLSGLVDNADFRLLDGDRKELVSSTNVGVVEASITRNLSPGRYFVEVSGRSTEYSLISEVSEQNRYDLYSGNGLLSENGTVSPTQIPLPEAQVSAIASAFNIPLANVPASFIAPRDARESLFETGTTLNTELFDGESTGLVGYISHALDSSDVDALSLFPVPILDVGLLPINPAINLARELGYTLEFSISVDSIFADGPDSSGFSVVVIGKDGTTGIELGWTASEVISRASDFSVSARSPFASSSLTSYSLSVAGDAYRLEADGSVILSGSLQQYQFSPVSAEPIIPFNPYETSNYIFIGDNYDDGRSVFSVENIVLYS